DGDHILIHDPWVEDERQETILDAANIPVPYDIFMNMAQFGRDGLRAAITLGKR
ncbi:MAG: GNAT family N-acetyltransferase, partial [Mesorhizobium sp.]